MPDYKASWLDIDTARESKPPWPLEWPLRFVFGAIGDYRRAIQSPFAGNRWARKRELEYVTGRYLAERGLADMGCHAPSVSTREDRAPIWPAGYRGSISHSDEFAFVVVTPNGVRGLGVDLEQLNRVDAKLYDNLFTSSEIERYTNSDLAHWPDLLFSAKEAVYKAVNPLVGRFIGFQEVEVDVEASGNRFRMHYVGAHEPNRVMEQGQGFIEFREHHVFTLFVIPAHPANQPA